MPIKIRCSCGAILLAPEERIGQTGKCPSCSRSIAVDLSMSKTQEILHKLELEKTQRTQQEQLKETLPITKGNRKPSFVNKMLAFFVYTMFGFLIVGTFLLHYLTDIDNKVKDTFLESVWQENREILMYVKDSHTHWYQNIFGTTNAPKK